MPQIINTNIPSLNAQRNLNTSQNSLATSLQRLSSGLRINSAKDDAAGLGITERMTTQIRGLNQATRNANDGISLAQTGEGALAEISNNLQRVRELAVQSANATNSASDRAALDLEVQQRIAEINRVATQTSFNGLKILDGTFGNAAFQVGANVGETITLNLQTSMKTVDMGAFVNSAGTAAVDATALTPITSGAWGASTITSNINDYTGVDANPIDAGANLVTINGTNIAASATYAVAGNSGRSADSAYAKAAAINATNISDVRATASTTWTVAQVTGGLLVDSATADIQAGDTVGYGLTINGVKVISETTSGLMTSTKETITIDEAISYINAFSAETGVLASEAANGDLVLSATDGRNIEVTENWAFTDGTTAASDSSGAYASVFGTATLTDDATASNNSASFTQAEIVRRGQVTLGSGTDVTISAGLAIIGFGSGTLTASSNLEAQNVLNVTAAENLIRSVDSSLTRVTDLRATFGSIQNRFETVITNLATTAENLTASRSRIQDADFAAETANLTRAQILQQAGVAMLAQANALPNNVLQLLQR